MRKVCLKTMMTVTSTALLLPSPSQASTTSSTGSEWTSKTLGYPPALHHRILGGGRGLTLFSSFIHACYDRALSMELTLLPEALAL